MGSVSYTHLDVYKRQELLAMKAPDGPLGGLAVGDFKRRIEDMNAVLDDALSGQEKLL